VPKRSIRRFWAVAVIWFVNTLQAWAGNSRTLKVRGSHGQPGAAEQGADRRERAPSVRGGVAGQRDEHDPCTRCLVPPGARLRAGELASMITGVACSGRPAAPPGGPCLRGARTGPAGYVCAGQSLTQERSPEPCAQGSNPAGGAHDDRPKGGLTWQYAGQAARLVPPLSVVIKRTNPRPSCGSLIVPY
jgi:hypothetical protein